MDVNAIRAALRCDRPNCPCQRPRGRVHCPAHDNACSGTPDLSVDEGSGGRPLVYCFVCREQESIIEALRARGLWDGKPPAPALSRLRRGRLEGPLNDVARFIERYVRMPSDHATTAVALWVAHTWVLDAFDVSPYLIVKSVEKKSGKTRLLEALELLTLRPWRVVQPSEAIVFRKVAKDRPVLLLDEGDVIFNARNNGAEPLRAILNAGNRRGVLVPRCVPEGKVFRLVEFSTFCAKAIAGIGNLPDTVEDRGIIIRLDRATPAEQRGIRRLRFREAGAEAAPIREALAKWAVAALPELREARPALPEALDGRAADAWEPLLVVAEEAGDGWAVAAWEAALALSTGAGREDDSIRVRLLRDCHRVFEESGATRLATADLVEGLCEDETSPWGDWRGRRITPQALARMLKPFGVHAERWRDGSQLPRGYAREAFGAAWARYLPGPPSPSTALDPEQLEQSSRGAGFGGFDEPEQTPLVPVPENGANPVRTRIVPSVPVQTPQEGEEAGDGELVTPEDLEKGGGAGQFVLRVGEATAWHPYTYRPGWAIAAGKAAWIAFVRNNPEAEVARAAAAMIADPALNGEAAGA